MKSLIYGIAAICSTSVFVVPSARAGAIAPGDLVVVQAGAGTITPGATGIPVALQDYQVTYTGIAPTALTLVQTIDLPTATSGAVPTTGSRYLVQGGTAGGEGGLYQSTDGRYMTLAGYNAIVGGVTTGTGGTEDRVVGRLDLSTGVVDTTTALVGGATSASARGAFTTNGSDIWTAFSNGARYDTFGVDNTGPNGNGVSLAGASNSGRRIVIYNGQLYQSEGANNRSGIETIGTGAPKTTGQTVSLLPGFSITSATYSDYDFFFANNTTLYIADDGASSSTAPGLQKWTFDGTTWTKAFNHPVSSQTAFGMKGLSGYVDPDGNVIMFASTTGASANFLLGLTDTLIDTTGSAVTETTLLTDSTNLNFRGMAVNLPEPSSLALFGIAGLGLLRRRRR